MDRAGGGWTLGVKHWYTSGLGTTAAYSSVANALTKKGTPYKLADSTINAIIGTAGKFDVMIDQAGYNSAYANGNKEYIVIEGYTGVWTWGTEVAESETIPTMKSYRISDDALMWTGQLKCANFGSGSSARGINCKELRSGTTSPAGGKNCNPKVGGESHSDGWHHMFMHHTNSDTYFYICNGAQHSSSYDLNHRYWFRPSA
uniref:Uncharacterized protein n=1 Tax=Haptolina ericina TaxID=156174 RepID=A0A7S3AYM2_9EUKA